MLPVHQPPPILTAALAPWRAQDVAYQAHAATCPNCIAAAHGHSSRCRLGAALWSDYLNAYNAPNTKHKEPA